MSDTFDAVGGHAANIFYGSKTDDGKKTLQKATTAWEIIYYLAMAHGTESISFVESAPALSANEKSETLDFLRAVQGLEPFAPVLFSIRFPAEWAPSTDAVAAALAPLGGVGKLRDAWLETRNAELTPLWPALFTELFVGSLPIGAFSEEFDQPTWGIGLVDETSHMRQAAVMDIKVGFFRHSPFTLADKVERINKKGGNYVSRETALRICGLRRYLLTDDAGRALATAEKESQGKEAGYAFKTPAELTAGVRSFFSTQGHLLRPESDAPDAPLVPVDRSGMTDAKDAAVVQRWKDTLKTVNNLLHFYEETGEGRYLIVHMAFVSASLLFTYDAQDAKGGAVLRLIDFARCGHRRLNFGEEKIGFVQGLRNLRSYLSQA